MSTTAQIEANRINAQSSTGPASPEGLKRSSLNATRHGFTGQQVILSGPEEKAAYDTHCISLIELYQPKTHEETDLIQQYADQEWTLHQISVQQMNVLAFLGAATQSLVDAGAEFEAINAATAPYYKQLNTLGIYEQRRRRAAKETLARFQELVAAREKSLAEAAAAFKAMKSQNKPFDPTEFGFVHSLPEIEAFLVRQSARATLKTLPSSAKF
jgi:hypothetical protein